MARGAIRTVVAAGGPIVGARAPLGAVGGAAGAGALHAHVASGTAGAGAGASAGSAGAGGIGACLAAGGTGIPVAEALRAVVPRTATVIALPVAVVAAAGAGGRSAAAGLGGVTALDALVARPSGLLLGRADLIGAVATVLGAARADGCGGAAGTHRAALVVLGHSSFQRWCRKYRRRTRAAIPGSRRPGPSHPDDGFSPPDSGEFGPRDAHSEARISPQSSLADPPIYPTGAGSDSRRRGSLPDRGRGGT